MSVAAELGFYLVQLGGLFGLLCLVYQILVPSKSQLPLINDKQPWEVFTTNAKRRFQSKGADLIRQGYSKVDTRRVDLLMHKVTYENCRNLRPSGLTPILVASWSCRENMPTNFRIAISSVSTQ